MQMRNSWMRLVTTVGLALGLWIGSGQAAQATPVPPGGFSLIEVTSLGLLAPLSPAILAPGEADTLFGAVFARFPIVDVTGPLGSPAQIAHTGGLSLSSDAGSVSLTNFVIDLVAGRVFAEVDGSGSANFPLFDLVPCSALGLCPVGGASSIVTGIGLNFTPEAAGAISDFFDVNLPAGTPFGILKQVTVVVPEPGTALLLFSGLSGLAWASRRRA